MPALKMLDLLLGLFFRESIAASVAKMLNSILALCTGCYGVALCVHVLGLVIWGLLFGLLLPFAAPVILFFLPRWLHTLFVVMDRLSRTSAMDSLVEMAAAGHDSPHMAALNLVIIAMNAEQGSRVTSVLQGLDLLLELYVILVLELMMVLLLVVLLLRLLLKLV